MGAIPLLTNWVQGEQVSIEVFGEEESKNVVEITQHAIASFVKRIRMLSSYAGAAGHDELMMTGGNLESRSIEKYYSSSIDDGPGRCEYSEKANDVLDFPRRAHEIGFWQLRGRTFHKVQFISPSNSSAMGRRWMH
jgi:hypothetical protein